LPQLYQSPLARRALSKVPAPREAVRAAMQRPKLRLKSRGSIGARVGVQRLLAGMAGAKKSVSIWLTRSAAS
jgi:hypothetical protein